METFWQKDILPKKWYLCTGPDIFISLKNLVNNSTSSIETRTDLTFVLAFFSIYVKHQLKKLLIFIKTNNLCFERGKYKANFVCVIMSEMPFFRL